MLRFQQEQSCAAADIERIAEENGISKLLAAALAHRKLFEQEDIRAFLHPSASQMHDAFLLPDMEAAVKRIRQALNKQEHICVYGDYDVDGVCATAMLLTCLKKHGALATPSIPLRHADGYGLHEEAIHALAQQGVQLMITVDNGISAKEEIAMCYELGIDVIVTDHHQCPGELPQCEAVVNPHLEHSVYPYVHLCGAGVVLKLITALFGEESDEYLALCALATVADVVELKGENRAIVALGLPHIAEHIGLKALLEVSGSGGQPVTSETLAFRLAPRLNAAGRMGDAMLALKLLITQDAEEARRIALELNEANNLRQRQELSVLQEIRGMLYAYDTVRRRAILLSAPHWNPGILGIVAARLREEYYRPVLLFSQKEDILTGSCRSIPGVHLYNCLQAFEMMFIRFGGHAMAAGITMKQQDFSGFAEAFEDYLKANIPHDVFIPTIAYEQESTLSSLSAKDIKALEALAPFGQGNPAPVLRANGITLTGIERMGKERTHLRAMARQGKARLGVVAFGQGQRAAEWMRQGGYEMLYTPMLNDWQGMQRLQLQARAVRQETILDRPEALPTYQANFYNAFFNNFLYNGVQDTELNDSDADAEVLQALTLELAGTLVLCFTPVGAVRLSNMLRASGLKDNVQVYIGKIPANAAVYHTVLLAPELYMLDTTKYTTVIAYDGKTSRLLPGQGETLLQAPLNIEMLLPLRLNRSEMAGIYRRYVSILQDGSQKWQTVAKGCVEVSYESALLSLLVFIELGFITWIPENGTLCIAESCAMRDLMQSRLYSAVNMYKT